MLPSALTYPELLQIQNSPKFVSDFRLDIQRKILRRARIFLYFFERFELIVSHFSTSRKILENFSARILGSRIILIHMRITNIAYYYMLCKRESESYSQSSSYIFYYRSNFSPRKLCNAMGCDAIRYDPMRMTLTWITLLNFCRSFIRICNVRYVHSTIYTWRGNRTKQKKPRFSNECHTSPERKVEQVAIARGDGISKKCEAVNNSSRAIPLWPLLAGNCL